MTDLAKIAIQIDSSGAKQGADEAVRSAERVGQAFQGMDQAASRSGQTLGKMGPAAKQATADVEGLGRSVKQFADVQKQAEGSARNLTRALVREYNTAQAQIRERLIRGFITPAEAQKQGREAAQAFNQGVLQTIQVQGAAGGFSGVRGQALYTGLARQLKDVSQAAPQATGAMRTFAAQLATIAAAQVGIRGTFAGLATGIGALSLGALTTAGVMAGLAALSFAYDKLTKGARKAKEETDKLVESLVRAGKERAGLLQAEEQAQLFTKLGDLNQRIAKELQTREIVTGQGFVQRFGGKLSEQTKKDIADLSLAFSEFYAQQGEKAREAAENAQNANDELIRAARQRRDAHLGTLIDIAEAEGRMFDAIRLRQEADVNRLLDLMKTLPEAGRRAAAQLIAALRSIDNDPLVKAVFAGTLTGVPQVSRTGFAPPGLRPAAGAAPFSTRQGQRTPEQIRAETQAQQALIEQYRQAARMAVEYAQALGGLSGSMGVAISATIDFIASIKELKLNPDASPIGLASAGFGIVSAIGGIAKGILDSGADARRAARELERARKEWDRTLTEWVRDTTENITEFQRAILDARDFVERQFLELISRGDVRIQKFAKKLKGDPFGIPEFGDLSDEEFLAALRDAAKELPAFADEFNRLADAFEKATAAAKQRREEEERRAAQDLDVRFLEAIGQSGAAADLRFQLEQQRELDEARRAGRSEDFLKRLEDVLQLEAQARERAEGQTGSVSNITALTETTGLRIDSRLFTTNTLLRQIELNTRARNVLTVLESASQTVDGSNFVRVIERANSDSLTVQASARGVRPIV